MRDAVEAFEAAVVAGLGYGPGEVIPGKFTRFATRDRRGDSAGWCKLFDDLRGGVFGCYRKGISEIWSAADKSMMTRQQRAELARQITAATTERMAVQRQQWAESAKRMARLWADCVPLVPGDPVTLYLKGRGFGGAWWPLPDVLRYHRALPYWQDGEKLGTYPAMLAPLVAPGGRMVALHRTYLTRDGRKANVPTLRKVTAPAGPLAGACIPLFKPERGQLGVAEGIETALAGWCASGMPTVAAYCADNLAAWLWPPGLQRLVVFADADKAGRESANTLRTRALAAGLRVDVLTPSTDGADWCDVWAARGAVEVPV